MALARAVVAGLLVVAASIYVGHSTAAPPTRVVVSAAPFRIPLPDVAAYAATLALPATTTTIHARTRVNHASRGSTGPRPTSVVDDAFWRRVANCESPSNARSRNGLYGGYFQMTQSAWHGGGGEGVPETHSYEEQLVVAKAWAARTNPWRQWPVCWPRAARG